MDAFYMIVVLVHAYCVGIQFARGNNDLGALGLAALVLMGFSLWRRCVK